jgi:anti-anti-sigma factor
MERHHMKMAVGVCSGSDRDALRGVANQTQTAFDENIRGSVELSEAKPAVPSVSRRMHTLILTGSLDRGSVHQLEAEMERLCEEGVSGVTLDLRGLTHIEAIGVSVIAFRCGLYQRRGYEIALIRGPRIVQRVFEAAGLGELLPFRDGPEAPSTGEQQPSLVSEPRVAKPVLEPAPALVLAPALEALAGAETA